MKKKPLWQFFNDIRKKTPILLSVDQYFYFLEAFQQLPANAIIDYRELREFTKIFWLKDYEYERDYNSVFEIFIEKETFQKLFFETEEKKPETPGNSDHENPGTDINGGAIDTDETTDGNDGSQPDTDIETGKPKVANVTEEEFIDFDLVISEQVGGVQSDHIAPYAFEHLFALNDQSIMPFKLRHFAQRLRRKVETSVKETSEELNIEVMIEQYSKYRYIDKIVYKLRDSSRSNVILLADRYGSMLSYEYLEKHLIDSVRVIPDCAFEHYYFYNLPRQVENTAHYQLNNAGTGKPTLNTLDNKWNSDSWFFIFSDAGAHSGALNKDRMRATLNMWNYFKTISRHVYWINPVPQKFMGKSTAKRLNLVIPMVYPVQNQLNKFFNKV